MNINQLGSSVISLFKNSSNENVQQTNQNPLIPEQKVDSKEKLMLGNMQPNMGQMSPIDQYKYMSNQLNIQLKQDPEKALKEANQIINSAMLPPVLNNPSSNILPEAMRVKRQASANLDKVV